MNWKSHGDIGNHLQNAGMQIVCVGGMTYYGRGLKSAITESMNFEQQMANVKAVSGSTGAEMKKLSELAVIWEKQQNTPVFKRGQGIEN
ncbi:hypothetical protein ACPA9J_16985 [Pseudomonas aeruginosa]